MWLLTTSTTDDEPTESTGLHASPPTLKLARILKRLVTSVSEQLRLYSGVSLSEG